MSDHIVPDNFSTQGHFNFWDKLFLPGDVTINSRSIVRKALNGIPIHTIDDIEKMDYGALKRYRADLVPLLKSNPAVQGRINAIDQAMRSLAAKYKEEQDRKQYEAAVGTKQYVQQNRPDSNAAEPTPDVKVQPWSQPAGSVTKPEEYRNAVAKLEAGSPDFLFRNAIRIYNSMSENEKKSSVTQAALKEYTEAYNATYY